MEKFHIRPRLRVGSGAQMTFLVDRRSAIDQSYRRTQGISQCDDEAAIARIVNDNVLPSQKLRGLAQASYRIDLGASLKEWRYKERGQQGISCSKEWLVTHR